MTNERNKEIQSPYHQMDELFYETWEMLDDPKKISSSEINLARSILDLMRIDIGENYIINFRTTPSHIGNLVVNIKRLIEVKSP